jgi:hypothetical protein
MEKNNIVKQVDNFERLKEENKQLVDDTARLEEEVEALKSPIKYQDFIGSLSAVEEFLPIIVAKGNCLLRFFI